MTNKERIIKAIKETNRCAAIFKHCRLCKVVGKANGYDNCKPCPLTDVGDFYKGCEEAAALLRMLIKDKRDDLIKKYKKIIVDELETFPPSQFTVKGWKYFDGIRLFINLTLEAYKEGEIK